jgi:PAS domain S-box-containing protein
MDRNGSLPTVAAPPRTSLEALIASAGDVAVIGFSLDGSVTEWGPGAEGLLGFPEDEALGMTFADFHGVAAAREVFGTRRQPPAVDPVAASPIQIEGRNSGGRTREFRITFQATEAGHGPTVWRALYRDVTTTRSAPPRDEAASGAEPSPPAPSEGGHVRELLLNVVESLHVGLCLIEANSNQIYYVNEALLRITGFSIRDLVGTNFECALGEWDEFARCLLPHIDAIRTRSRAAGTAHWNVALPTGERTLACYGQRIFPDDRFPNFLILVIEDITEKQRLSAQLVQSEKLAAIGQLAAGIAHEIRSPLAAIYNALYDLDQITQGRDADIREDVAIATEEIRRVQDIINNLLDFARDSERGSGHADVNEAVERTLRIIHKDLASNNITIRTQFGDVPRAIISPNALKQILINLFANASQAMAGTGGTLTVTTERRPGPVNISAMHPRPNTHSPMLEGTPPPRPKGSEHIAIRVSDTGPGIPPDILPMIFNPFFTTKPPGQGTGLGLSVVHSAVRDAGGLISVQSERGRGATFIIELPAEEEEPVSE